MIPNGGFPPLVKKVSLKDSKVSLKDKKVSLKDSKVSLKERAFADKVEKNINIRDILQSTKKKIIVNENNTELDIVTEL
jgi:hypothetical protein